ncbi:MAG: outer membrane beta-barrel protein [Candidatus Aminicenantes bacterium]|nr:outer membrane beta-barrel protein [Candidatus Aminicenantes bacterium]
MKKIIFIAVFLMGICFVHAWSGDFSVVIGGGIKNAGGIKTADGKNLFEEVYGKNNLSYSLDVGYKAAKYIQLFLHGEYFSTKGELTYTKEETTLTIIPVELGCRFMYGFAKDMFCPYIGLGGGFYLIKEENVIAPFDEKKFGFFGETGFAFYFVKYCFLDLKARYVFLKIDGAEGEVDLGGLALMGGIGFSF